MLPFSSSIKILSAPAHPVLLPVNKLPIGIAADGRLLRASLGAETYFVLTSITPAHSAFRTLSQLRL